MNGTREDIEHHFPEHIKGYIRNAEIILSDIGIPVDYNSLLFLKVVELLSAKSVQITQVQPAAFGLTLPPR